MCRAGRQSLPRRRSLRSLEWKRPGPRASARRAGGCACQPDRSSPRSRPPDCKRRQGRQSPPPRRSPRSLECTRPGPRASARSRRRRCACRPDRSSPCSRPPDCRRRRGRQSPPQIAVIGIGVRRGERGGARARATVCAGRIGRRRARARQTVSARGVDNLRRSGGRPGDRNISARRGERGGGARARAARLCRQGRSSARSRPPGL